MTSFQCPTCGGEGRFGSGAPYAVCRFCRSLLLRTDVTLQSVGRVAAVPDDFSPLQLGVGGQFDQRHFSVVGRIRKVWEQGSWNEWCVMFDPQRFGWLAEAQGDLVMTFEQPRSSLEKPPAPAQAAQVEPGATWRIGGRNFTVTDVKEVSCQGAEGELSGISSIEGNVLSIDLHGAGLEFATVEFRGDGVTPYVGRFVEFADCQFSNLRRIAGWNS
jgi:Domain of unknown function (DUF4178)